MVKKTVRLLLSIAFISGLFYLLISLFFFNHFFFNTTINGVDVSLKTYEKAEYLIKKQAENYKLIIIERNKRIEVIRGQDIKYKYNEKSKLQNVVSVQKPFMWINSIFTKSKYQVNNLFIYDKELVDSVICMLKCLNSPVIEPSDVSFKYSNGSYILFKEVEGNKIITSKFKNAIYTSLSKGKVQIDLNKNGCYQNPKFTLKSPKTEKTKKLLNKYISTKITYVFGDAQEALDKETIKEFISVDDKLDIVISKVAVMMYVKELSKKYDTVGSEREFKTTLGTKVKVRGGLYGWKINKLDETEAIIGIIKEGKEVIREPIYSRKAAARGEKEQGDTYVEINITRQYLWYYKERKLIASGPIVSGNPNKGHSTSTGFHMLNYKEKNVTLKGADYESKVSYWMPFYGNIGIHDAKWRYLFGGEIYTKEGSHGCVNVQLYLAKKIYENIEKGTPIICYKE